MGRVGCEVAGIGVGVTDGVFLWCCLWLCLCWVLSVSQCLYTITLFVGLMRVWWLLLVVGLVLGFYVDTDGVLLLSNDTVDYRGTYYLKVFDLQRWWDAGYSRVLVRASVGAEWVFERVEGSVVDFALFWEDCTWCDSGEPPPVKNRNTIYEDEILRVTYVGGRWVVRVLWHQGGFTHWVYVNGSLFFTHYSGSAGGGPWEVFPGEVLRLELRSSGDSKADSYAVFFSPSAWRGLWCSGPLARLGWAAAVGLDVREVNALLEGTGLSVSRVDRRDGAVRFVLSNGSVVSVPVLFEVQSNGTGFFMVGNPSCVDVTYVAVVRFSRGGVGGELHFNVTVSPLDAVVLAPVVFRGGDGESEASLFLYVSPGVYRLGNFSVAFDRERLVAGNRSVLLRWLHAVFLPPETRRLVDAVGWCNSEFWRAFDEVADPYDYSLIGDFALTVVPVGKLANFLGKVLARGASAAGDVISAIKAATYALSSSKWARAVGTAAGYVIPDIFIAEDILQLLDPAAAEEMFSAFGVDLSEVERFHVGVLTASSCRNAGRYYAAVYVSWVTRASAVVDLASNLYAKVSKDALERFGRAFVGVAQGKKIFSTSTHAAYVAARAWGPYGVNERMWAAAFDKLSKALTGRDDVAAVVAPSRSGVVKSDRYFHLVSSLERKGDVYYFNPAKVEKSAEVSTAAGPVLVFYSSGKEVGGGLYLAFLDTSKLIRWTSPEFFEELRRVGLAKLPWVEFNPVEKDGVRYLCFSYTVVYNDMIYAKFSELIGEADLAQWRQRFAALPLFSVLGIRIDVRLAAYEVDLAAREKAIEILERPVTMEGLVGYLQNTQVLLKGLDGVYVHITGVRDVAPDGLALAQWNGWRVIVAEVERRGVDAVSEYEKTLGLLESIGVLRGGSFTEYGVALSAFRVDALRGVTAGGNALRSDKRVSEQVGESILACPQAKSGLVEWASLLDKKHEVAPLLAVYEGEGPVFTVRGILFERLVDFKRSDVESVVRRCLG